MKKFAEKMKSVYYGHTFFFIPLIIMGGRLAIRIIMNTWNMIES